MTIRVVEVRPGRWSYMIDGEFPADLYDATWGLTTSLIGAILGDAGSIIRVLAVGLMTVYLLKNVRRLAREVQESSRAA